MARHDHSRADRDEHDRIGHSSRSYLLNGVSTLIPDWSHVGSITNPSFAVGTSFQLDTAVDGRYL